MMDCLWLPSRTHQCITYNYYIFSKYWSIRSAHGHHGHTILLQIKDAKRRIIQNYLEEDLVQDKDKNATTIGNFYYFLLSMEEKIRKYCLEDDRLISDELYQTIPSFDSEGECDE